MDAKLEALRHVPLFAGLDRKEITEVGRLSDEVDLKAGHVLMREGGRGEEFFLVLSGFVRVERGGTVVATLGSGEFFGEISLVDHGPRTATVTCDTDCRVLVLGHREFDSLLDRFPAVQGKVLRALAERVRRLEPEAVN
jgi:CRP/FNR family transcriptional regulator, cyclic AMP receptor protein